MPTRRLCARPQVVTQNAAGEIEPRAFMASDQAMALERDRVLDDSKDPELVQVRKERKGEVLPRVIRQVWLSQCTARVVV